MVGDGAAGQHQVAGPGGDVASLGRRRTRCDPLTAAAVIDAQAVTAARGVLQQVRADGHGQGFGGLDRFGAGFALENTGNVFFAIQTRHEFVVQQKQFAVAVNIQHIAVGEFDTVITLQCPGSNCGVPCQHAPKWIAGEQVDLYALPCIHRPCNRSHRRQCLRVISKNPLTGAPPAGPDRCTIRCPTGKPALSRCCVLIRQPAPGLHPQAASEFANDLAIGGIEHHIEQHSPGLTLRRQHGQHRQ
ncbi:hypothetical protein D3C78_1081130 [compost metagenome]